jgi:TolA-binding protein
MTRWYSFIPMNENLSTRIRIVTFLFFFLPLLPSHLHAQETSKDEEVFFMAQKAFEDGFYDVSTGLIARFLKNYPSSSKAPEANLLLGECYFHQNKFIDALAQFEQLVNQPSAKNIQDACFYWIAEVHFRGNNYEKAAEYYKRVIESYPQSPYCPASYYSLGWCLFQEHEFAEAMTYFEAVKEKFPKEQLAQDASFKAIECLYNLKDYQKLKERLNSSLALYSKDAAKLPYLYFYLAETEYYLNNFETAVNNYTKVIAATSDEKIISLSWLGVGWSHLKLKQYPEAESAFAQVKPEDLETTSQEILLLGKAVLLSETKRLTEATSLYDQLISVSADSLASFQAYLGKAEVLYNLGEYQKALDVYKEASARLTSSTPQEIVDKLHYGLAWAYLKQGEFKSAIDEFQKIVKQTDDKIIKVAALCQIGDAYQDSGDYAKAIESYDSILKDFPASVYTDYVQYQLGLGLLKSSNYDGAIMAFQSLKTGFPNSKLLDDATYALGLSYFQREDYNASREIFGKFQEEFKESNLRPQAMYLMGTSLFNLGKFTEAIEVFKDIVKTYGHDTELTQKAEYEIADCYYQMGNEQEAMERFKALRSKYPDSSLTPEVMWWLGEYHARHNEFDLARRYFTSLIQDFPKSSLIADAYYALGTINEIESKYDDAITNFKKVAEAGKSDLSGTAQIAIADVYVKQGQTDSAIEMYKQVVATYSNLVHLIYPKMADVYRDAGRYDEALEYYTKSLTVVPVRQMGLMQFKIGETKEAQGKKDEAIEEYLKVTYMHLENDELGVKALLRIAAIYEEKENFKEAKNVYQKIASMNISESKYAQERIEWINERLK